MNRQKTVFAFVFCRCAALCIILCGCDAMRNFSCGQPQAFPDNCAVSLDWPGTYRGVVPCADCEGIETAVTLNPDLTYVVKTRYQGKDEASMERSGTFAWNEAGTEIRLNDMAGGPDRYLVGANAIFQLDNEGKKIAGDLAGKYVLRKTAGGTAPTPEVLAASSPWRLVALVGERIAPPAAGGEAPFLVFEPEGGRIHGFGGCNSFFGRCEYLPGDMFRFSNIASTKKACPDMTVESEFLNVLENADNYAIRGNVLELRRGKMAPLAALVSSAAPDSAGAADPGIR